MRKLLLFLLFPSLLFAQVEFLGIISIDTIRYDWGNALELLQQLPTNIKTKDSAEVIFIPFLKIYDADSCYAILFDDITYVLYEYDDKNDKVTILEPETWLVEHNLKNKKFKDKKKYNNDNYDILKPKDLENKVKKIHKEKHKIKPKK